MFQELLPNGGVAVHIEDWSAVAGFIQKLRDSGEEPLAYCAKHSDEYQGLHAQVLLTDTNEAGLRIIGASHKSQILGPLSAILPYSVFTFPRWLAAIARGDAAYRGQAAIRRLDGQLSECLVAAALPSDLAELSRIAVLAIDITEYRGRAGATMLSTIQHASRLSAMGALTASIAHEVKNPLAAIATNAGASRRWLRQAKPNLAEADAAIANVVQDAKRAREIVDRTLSFLRPAPSGKIMFDIVTVVNDVIPMIIGDLRRCEVEIQFKPTSALPQVFADPIQVQQVLVNLILNATQALSETNSVRLITVGITGEDKTVTLEVADNGPGIAPEHLSRLFEPFYSTKSGGIGMGLAVCKDCVEANGGRIWANSVPSKGSSFFFTLQAQPQAAAPCEPNPPGFSPASSASRKPDEF